MNRVYELMLVLSPDFDSKDEKKVKDLISKLVGVDSSVSQLTMIGKKALAYPIKKFTEGIYVLAKLSGLIKVEQIEKQVKLNELVLRYLLTAK